MIVKVSSSGRSHVVASRRSRDFDEPRQDGYEDRIFNYAELIEIAGLGCVPKKLRARVAEAVSFLKWSEGW